MKGKKKFDDINVVPFIDIMLVLLVIVLTTASFIQTGVIKVDLPKTSKQNTEKPKDVLRLAIDPDGKIFLDKIEVAKAEIESVILKHDKESPVNIFCDKEVKFDTFVFVMDIMKRNGYKKLGIVTKYE